MPRKGYKQTDEQKKRKSEAMKGHKLTTETKNRISKTLKNREYVGPFKKGHSIRNTGRTHLKKGAIPWNKGLTGYTTSRRGQKHTEETKRILRDKRKSQVCSEETRRKMSATKKRLGNDALLNWIQKEGSWNKGLTKETDPRVRKNGEAERGKIVSEVTKQRQRKARLGHVIPTTDTSIEIALQEELDRRGRVYEKHLPVEGICQPDIVFPSLKVAVFADGDYWHRKDERAIEKDQRQNMLLNDKGWVVLRFWEHEINKDVSECVDKIIEVIG